MRFQSPEEVRLAWDEQQISRLDYVTSVCPFLTAQTIDEIAGAMPRPVLDTFERFARGYCDQEQVSIGRGPRLADPPDLGKTLVSWLERRA